MTNGGTLDDVYFEWLYNIVAVSRNRNPSNSYWNLCRKLYTTEFIWYVANDDNRVEDGRELRFEFFDKENIEIDRAVMDWTELGCTMLELLIVLARMAAFETDKPVAEWFWRLMHNLELERYSDDIYEISIQEEVEEVLERVVNRTYSPDGVGGLFPIRHPARDQRNIELWDQMSAYLLEGLYVNTRPLW